MNKRDYADMEAEEDPTVDTDEDMTDKGKEKEKDGPPKKKFRLAGRNSFFYPETDAAWQQFEDYVFYTHWFPHAKEFLPQ